MNNRRFINNIRSDSIIFLSILSYAIIFFILLLICILIKTNNINNYTSYNNVIFFDDNIHSLTTQTESIKEKISAVIAIGILFL